LGTLIKQGGFLRINPLLHAMKIALLTFIISLVISYLSGFPLGLGLSLVILLVVILVGIIFDIVGTAVTAAEESPFHAMGADRVRGSKEAIYLIRHADRTANFCNDVVGDIAGTIGGALAAGIVLQLTAHGWPTNSLINAAVIALIAAVTVGGKSFGKFFAINQAEQIIFTVGKFLAVVKFIDIDLKKSRRKRRSNLRKVR
jgi:Mg2+/Co2+ transporter CorB